MLQDILLQTFFQNTVLNYLTALSIFLIGIFVVKIFKGVLLSRLKAWSAKTAVTIDDFLIQNVEKTVVPLLYFGAFYLGMRSLTLSVNLIKAINVIGAVLLTFFGIRFLVAIIDYSIQDYLLKKEMGIPEEPALKALRPVIKVLIWGFGVIFLLDNLGFEISTLVAGLGIGGIAVALAAQAVLGDLFSYFAIMIDRPFEIGDFIIVGDYLGTVEHVGIKTTRIRSLGGEQLVFSNTDLTNSRIRNYKRMEKRRVVFNMGVTYQTSHEKLKEIPTVIRNIIENISDTVFDRAHFSSYGDFSLVFDVAYYVASGDYKKYMDIQQEINLKIKEEFEKRGIEFAYPTQMVYLNKP
ncbi:MAG: mechanosensitive ion channel family protein [Candidatus Hydrothermarchaeaceae archaeon]